MEQVRTGIIGIGNIGSAHARCISDGKVPGMVLSALCDVSPKRREALAREYPGVPVFEDHHKLLESGLADAIIVSTPHYFHPEIAIDGFRAGCHVLTEKPAGVSVGAVEEMNREAERSGKIFGIMFNQRTDPLFQKAKALIDAGELGQPKRFVWIITNWYRTQAYYDSGDWRATWNGEGGGVLLNQAPHNLDLWQWIFGMPKRLRAFCSAGKYHCIPVEDDATLYAEYENGATAVFITSTGEAPGTNRLELSGDRGKLVLEDGKLSFWKLAAPEREFCFTAAEGFYQPPAEFSQYQAQPVEGHRAILENFTQAILTGSPLLAPGAEGIRELSLSNAAYLSSEKGEWVTLPPNPEEFDRFLERKREQEREKDDDIPEKEKKFFRQYDKRWQVRW